MNPDSEKRESNVTSIHEKLQEETSTQSSISAESVAEYLRKVRRRTIIKYIKFVYLPLIIIELIVIWAIYTYVSGIVVRILLIISTSFIVVGFYIDNIRGYYLRNLYKHHQEVQCPKCGEYIPLYIWKCPNCETVYKDTHIFHNCQDRGCATKVGKLHKNLQSIKCINENCNYELYFYNPYEGGFHEDSFRGD